MESTKEDIVYDKNYTFDLSGTITFDNIPQEVLYEIFKDGRNASFMLEEWLTSKFPLTRIKGNKDHDHIDVNGMKYDAKNFTKGGLKFMPSNQIGAGRSFNKEAAHEKASKLIYICCDIVEFPKLTVRFAEGFKMIEKYPNCAVPFKQRSELFK